MLLEAQGYRVLTAPNGQDALDIAESSQLDAVILDFSMPGMTGAELVQRLREAFPHLTLIMLSGYPDDVPPETLALTDAFLCKGGGPDELLRAIRITLDGRGRLDGNPYVLFRNNPLIPELLRSCIEATRADFGNIQLFNSSRQDLTIVSHHSFGSEFLNYFRKVDGGSFRCGAAMNQRSQVVVPDVASDPLFQDPRSREVMLCANVHSVQSTPLITSSGRFLGVASTHFARPRRFSPEDLEQIDVVVNPLLAEIMSNNGSIAFDYLLMEERIAGMRRCSSCCSLHFRCTRCLLQ